VLSGPAISQAANAPLAGLLSLMTDTETRVSVSISDGSSGRALNFFDYTTNHSITLLGFKPSSTNQITVTIRDKYRNAFTSPIPLRFVALPLPVNMPLMTLKTNSPGNMEPGYTLFRAANNNNNGVYATIVDQNGQVVWYSPLPSAADVRQLANGDLFMATSDTKGFAEYNMLGQRVRTWLAPASLPVDSHENLLTDHGSILYINNFKQTFTNFPSSVTDSNAPPLATANVSCNRIIELSANDSSLLNTWSLIDMFDPVRIDYLTFLIPAYGIDVEHANAIIEDPRDNSIIVSMRNQDAVVKFSRTGQIKWILGPHENWGPEWQQYLLTPVGSPFGWQYGQHGPILTPQGTLLLYDDGNCRAEPFDVKVADQTNYSRAVEFSIDETNMQVSQVWEYGRTNDDRLYTDRVGNASWLPSQGNVLVTFGYVLYENGLPPNPFAPSATMVRIKEVTHNPEPAVVFDLQVFDSGNTNRFYTGGLVYRSYRIPDLYSHQPKPVADLSLHLDSNQPLLQFSADPTYTYVVEASDDLNQWQAIGTALPDDNNGDFSFYDEDTTSHSARFYRVVTQ